MFAPLTRALHLLLAPSTGRYSVQLYRFMEKSRSFCLFGDDYVLQIHSRSIEIFIRLSLFAFKHCILQIFNVFQAVTAKGERRIGFTISHISGH